MSELSLKGKHLLCSYFLPVEVGWGAGGGGGGREGEGECVALLLYTVLYAICCVNGEGGRNCESLHVTLEM